MSVSTNVRWTLTSRFPTIVASMKIIKNGKIAVGKGGDWAIWGTLSDRRRTRSGILNYHLRLSKTQCQLGKILAGPILPHFWSRWFYIWMWSLGGGGQPATKFLCIKPFLAWWHLIHSCTIFLLFAWMVTYDPYRNPIMNNKNHRVG